MKTIVENTALLDFKGLVLRAYYGNDHSIGRAVDALLTECIDPLLQVLPARRIIGCLDNDSWFRQALYPDYKKKRREGKTEATTREEEDVLNAARTALDKMGVLFARVEGTEADDLIAYFVENLPGNKNVQTLDGDLAVLAARDDTFVTVGREGVGDHYKDVPLQHLTVCKAIVGDTSDEYGGVPGVGPAGVATIAEKFGWDGVDELETWAKVNDPRQLNEALKQVQDKNLQAIADNWAAFVRCYKLATLRPDEVLSSATGNFRKTEWSVGFPDAAAFDRHMMSIGGHRFAASLPPGTFREDVLVTTDNLPEVWGRIFEEIDASPFVAVDYESYDTLKHEPFKQASTKNFVDVLHQKTTGMSLTCGKALTTTYYFSVGHRDTANIDPSVLGTLLQWVQDNGTPLVAHNAPFEIVQTLTNQGLDLGEVIDTSITAMYVDENLPNNLKALSLSTFGYKQATYEEVTQGRPMSEISGLDVLSYGCDDAICSALLLNHHNNVMHLEDTATFCMHKEWTFNRVMVDSFMQGERIDFDELSAQEKVAQDTIAEGTKTVVDLLKKHCTEPDANRANPLFQELWKYKDATSEFADQTARTAAYDELWGKTYYSSAFAEIPTQAAAVQEHKVTATNVNKLLEKVGVSPPLPSLSKKAIQAWVKEVSGAADTDPLVADDSHSDPGKQVVRAITEVAGKVKSKSGEDETPERRALVDLMSEVFGAKEQPGKVEAINFGSTPQMQSLLYAKLGFPIRCRVQVKPGSKRFDLDMEGGPSTDEHAIKTAIAEDTQPGDWKHDLLTALLKIFSAKTKVSNYFSKYPLWKSPDDGRLHGSIRNWGTVSGRPSGSQPNFLQVEKGDLRRAFVPDEGHVIVTADFSGQELRILGSESEDPLFLKAYLGDPEQDIHSHTAAGLVPHLYDYLGLEALGLEALGLEALGLNRTMEPMDYDEFETLRKSDSDLGRALAQIRNKFAKPLNFLVIYGGGPTKLAAKLMVPESLTRTMIDAWNARYPGVGEWKQKVVAEVMRTGYSTTAYGHRRHLGDKAKSNEGWERGRAERQLINNVVQGGAAGVLKTVVADAYAVGLFKKYGVTRVLPIYDELRASVPKENAAEYAKQLVNIMAVTPPGHEIPMVPEVSVGVKSWGDLVEIGRVDLNSDDDILRFQAEVDACIYPEGWPMPVEAQSINGDDAPF